MFTFFFLPVNKLKKIYNSLQYGYLLKQLPELQDGVLVLSMFMDACRWDHVNMMIDDALHRL